MEGVAGFGVGAVEEHVEAVGVAVEEAGGFEGGCGGGEDVYVLGVAHGGFVDARDPEGDGVAADDGVGDVVGLEGGGGSQEALAHFFHGVHHPVEGKFSEIHGHDSYYDSILSGCECNL